MVNDVTVWNAPCTSAKLAMCLAIDFREEPSMKPVIVFDMNETLLDMSALDPTLARIFGLSRGAELRKKWFRQVLELFLTATITGEYRNFEALSDEALQMVALQRGVEASASDRAALKEAQARIPAHADAGPGLERLKAAGFRTAVLSNSTEKASNTLLEFAGIAGSIDEVLSADAVKRYKPAREAYEYAAKKLGVQPKEIVLVAAHAWDIAGAMTAGCEAAFVARPEKVLNPGARAPRFHADSISALAPKLVAEYA
jgi:2-haloalkanoic acid dehalogenase, type II